eukprot:3203034-Amphidinium_carterae.1
MIPGDPSALRLAAAEALVSVAERGDEAAKTALLERLKADESWEVRWETSCSTPFRRRRQRGIPLPAARSRQSEGNKSHGTGAQQRIRSWWISHPIWGMGGAVTLHLDWGAGKC